MKIIYQIRPEDVGRSFVEIVACPCCHTTRKLDLGELMGQVLVQDVGKLVYESAQGITYVENDAQYRKRQEIMAQGVK